MTDFEHPFIINIIIRIIELIKNGILRLKSEIKMVFEIKGEIKISPKSTLN